MAPENIAQAFKYLKNAQFQVNEALATLAMVAERVNRGARINNEPDRIVIVDRIIAARSALESADIHFPSPDE